MKYVAVSPPPLLPHAPPFHPFHTGGLVGRASTLDGREGPDRDALVLLQTRKDPDVSIHTVLMTLSRAMSAVIGSTRGCPLISRCARVEESFRCLYRNYEHAVTTLDTLV